MHKFKLIEHVTLSDDTRRIDITISDNGVRVFLDNLHTPGHDTLTTVLNWDQLTDVDLLSNRFDEETVRVFRKLCEMFANIHSNQYIYQALI